MRFTINELLCTFSVENAHKREHCMTRHCLIKLTKIGSDFGFLAIAGKRSEAEQRRDKLNTENRVY